MPTLPSRKAMEEMKRPEIQKLCKDNNIKANLKTDALIELLLDKKTESTTPVTRTRRAVSTRHSSMIVHEADEQEEDHEEETENQPEPEPANESSVVPARSRKKAKETQTRLGVGRPAVAGGSGPRAVTKSVSVSKGKRGKSSRVVKPAQETIPEEVEDADSPLVPTESEPVAGPSEPTEEPSASISTIVESALQPLTRQLQSLQAELQQVRKEVAAIQALEQKIAALTASNSAQAATIASLQADLRTLQEGNVIAMNPRLIITNPSTPQLRSPLPQVNRPSKLTNNADLPNPGIAPTLLGKRSRDSTASNMTGIIEDGEQHSLSDAELANAVVRPTKKRPKLDEDADIVSGADGPAFAVYTGEEEPYVDPPPPTQRLPDFYGPSSPSASGLDRQTTSTQNATENQHPFTFAFTPTPADVPFDMPNFPYPEAPTSPSPAGTSNANPSLLRQGERTDIFQSFGLPAPTRPRSRLTSASTHRSTADNATLNKPEDAPSYGLRDALPDLDSQSALTRTMYGTESDDRFGDFGFQGVASAATGIWPGGRF
ncbi:hypothetical protein MIND_00496700 [Mycena indigotica]|uniref:Uncharacterized protein n=1 Tax=Mycena indigotica TaxID=2126181 RepID=A0A8H6W8L1_9AGAR|nr:uncharacterized protein MIND_00496700 [Mycena indigotica]KAF7307036.1 hypothetical protein MIND_00496700 [Mycena indigotica]